MTGADGAKFIRCIVGVTALAAALGPAAASAATCSGVTVSDNQCIPGGAGKGTDCYFEWITIPRPPLDKKSLPKNKLICYEGDPSCDADPDLNNKSCTISSKVCINNTDARLPLCTPSNLHTFQIKKPNPNSLAPADVTNVGLIEAQVTNFGVTIARNGIIISNGVPNATPNLCSATMGLVVPLRQTKKGKLLTGSATFRTQATTALGFLDTDTLRIQCRPSTCGNHIIEVDHENCDDGNRIDGDGCDHSCHSVPLPPTPTPTPTPFPCPAGVDCATYEIQPGFTDLLPTDDGRSSWLRVTDVSGLDLVQNATDGSFSVGPLILEKGAEDGNGVAPLQLAQTSYFGAMLPTLAQQLGEHGRVCVKVQPDPMDVGWIDCNGGSNADVSVTVNSNGAAASDPSVLVIGNGASDSGAGAAVIPVLYQFTKTNDDVTPCSAADYSSAPVIKTAFTTGLASGTVQNTLQFSRDQSLPADTTVTLSGQPFDCSTWGQTNGPAPSVVVPAFATDYDPPILANNYDIAMAVRAQLVLYGAPTPTPTFTAAPPTNTPTVTNTATSTPTLPPTPTFTFTSTPTNTPLPTATPTSTNSNTPLPTATPTITLTPTLTPLPTNTPTGVLPPTDTPTITQTPTDTPLPTNTPTNTPLPTNTPTNTPLPTNTPTNTPLPTVTPTATRTALGTLNLTVATGDSSLCPADSAAGSFLKTQGPPTGGFAGTVCSATRGNFTSGPIVLSGGTPNASGIASLSIASPVVIDAQQPSQASNDHVCWRLEANGAGTIDCDGGSNANATVTVSSNTTAAPPPPVWDNTWLSAPSGATNSGNGAAVIPVSVKIQSTTNACPGPGDSSWSGVTAHTTVAVTGTATVTINSARKCPGGNGLTGTCPNSPYVVSLSGTNFNCSNWTTNSGARLVIPLAELDVDFGSGGGATFGVGDLAEVARYND